MFEVNGNGDSLRSRSFSAIQPDNYVNIQAITPSTRPLVAS